MNSSNGNSRKRKSNFDHVPADDGFRTYMKQKIELQRKQFGLKLPPPPAPPSPSPQSTSSSPAAASSAPATPPPTILKRSVHSCSGHKKYEDSPAKSVRFHLDNDDTAKSTNVLLDDDAPKSMSDVLNNLNRRHSKRRKRRGRKASLSSHRTILQGHDSQDSSEAVMYDTPKEDTEEEESSPTDSTTSSLRVLDVLDNLQRKHGSSSSKRRRSSSSSAKKRKQLPLNSGTQSSLERLEVDSDAAAPASIEKIRNYTPSSSRSSNSSLKQRKRDSPRCFGTSVLEDLQPGEFNTDDNYLAMQSSLTSTNTPQTPASSRKQKKHRPDLFFTGIVVLVNGYTDPDAETIKRLLQKHGGDLEKYETSRVTHIIAVELSTAKANIYKRQKKPTPVCTPNWITDSVREQKLLPHADYLLKNVMDENVFGSKKVKSYFGVQSHNKLEMPPDGIEKGKLRRDEREKMESLEKRSEHRLEESVTKRPYRWHDKDPTEANYPYAGAKTVGNDPK
jgi:DNA repair protein REV1